jgi:hypothetical protein
MLLLLVLHRVGLIEPREFCSSFGLWSDSLQLFYIPFFLFCFFIWCFVESKFEGEDDKLKRASLRVNVRVCVVLCPDAE